MRESILLNYHELRESAGVLYWILTTVSTCFQMPPCLCFVYKVILLVQLVHPKKPAWGLASVSLARGAAVCFSGHRLHFRDEIKIYSSCLNLKNYSKRYTDINHLRILLITWNTLSHCHSVKLLWKFSFMTVFMTCDKNTVHSALRAIQQGGRYPHPPHSLNSVLSGFWLLPRVRMTMKDTCFELVQDTKAAVTGRKTGKTFRTA